MALLISTEGISRQQDLELRIDSIPFIVRFQWMERLQRWVVDFLTLDDQPILTGRVLIPNGPLTNRYTGDALPAGEFFAVRKDEGSEPFGLDELSTQCLFFFVPEDEVEAERPEADDDFGVLTFEVVP